MMKTIVKILLAAIVLSLAPTTYVCAQEEQTECNKRLLSCGKFYEGLAYYKDANKMYGFIDKTGKMVIPCQWRSVGNFSEGLALARGVNGKWGFIDKTGKVVIPCQWERASSFREGLAQMQVSYGKYDIIDKTGKIIE